MTVDIVSKHNYCRACRSQPGREPHGPRMIHNREGHWESRVFAGTLRAPGASFLR